MQTLILRYPVVFPDSDGLPKTSDPSGMNGMQEIGGLAEPMPHEFHDLIRDLLSKEPTERLGSEEFLDEFVNHSFFKIY
jgi:hypothetical protein